MPIKRYPSYASPAFFRELENFHVLVWHIDDQIRKLSDAGAEACAIVVGPSVARFFERYCFDGDHLFGLPLIEHPDGIGTLDLRVVDEAGRHEYV